MQKTQLQNLDKLGEALRQFWYEILQNLIYENKKHAKAFASSN